MNLPFNQIKSSLQSGWSATRKAVGPAVTDVLNRSVIGGQKTQYALLGAGAVAGGAIGSMTAGRGKYDQANGIFNGAINGAGAVGMASIGLGAFRSAKSGVLNSAFKGMSGKISSFKTKFAEDSAKWRDAANTITGK